MLPAGLKVLSDTVALYAAEVTDAGELVNPIPVDSTEYTVTLPEGNASGSGGVFRVSIPDTPKNTAYILQYTCEVTLADADITKFTNSAALSGMTGKPGSSEVEKNDFVISAGGGATIRNLNKLEITKTDDDEKVLPGAVFAIYKVTNNVNTFMFSVTTDADGKALIRGLRPDQKYAIEETKAPKGYELDRTIREISFDGMGATKKLTIKNEKTPPVSVQVTKTWEKDKEADRPQSIQVQLYNGEEAVGDPVTLDAEHQWSHVFTDLDADGNWKVDEVSVPNGYTKKITGSAADGYTITNTHTDSDIEDLSIVKKANVKEVKPGGLLTYTLNVKNKGDATLTGIVIRDYVPDYTLFYKFNDSIGKYGAINKREHVTWFIETLQAGESLELSFTVRVNTCIPNNAEISNTALYTVTDNPTPIYTNDPNDPAEKTNAVSVDVTASGKPDILRTGDDINMIIWITLATLAAIGLCVTGSWSIKKKKKTGGKK